MPNLDWYYPVHLAAMMVGLFGATRLGLRAKCFDHPQTTLVHVGLVLAAAMCMFASQLASGVVALEILVSIETGQFRSTDYELIQPTLIVSTLSLVVAGGVLLGAGVWPNAKVFRWPLEPEPFTYLKLGGRYRLCDLPLGVVISRFGRAESGPRVNVFSLGYLVHAQPIHVGRWCATPDLTFPVTDGDEEVELIGWGHQVEYTKHNARAQRRPEGDT